MTSSSKAARGRDGTRTLSVVIPTYNRAALIGAALESVLGQVDAAAQVIVVDDGSTDDTPAALAPFGDRIELLRIAHRGAGAARNAGLVRAEGRFIAFQDSDDLWTSCHMAVLEGALARAPEAGLAFGRLVEFQETEGVRAFHPNVKPAVGVATMLARREVFAKVGLFREDLRIVEFVDWASRAREAGIAMTVVEDVVLHRRVHAGNTVRLERAHFGDYARVVRAHLERRRAQNPEGLDPQGRDPQGRDPGGRDA